MDIRTRSNVFLAASLAALAIGGAAAVAHAGVPELAPMQPRFVISRPPLLPPMIGCTRWEGMLSGNDPSVMVRLRLCQSGAHVFGRLQWSSLRTGWNERNVDGVQDTTGAIVLHDTGFAGMMPAPGVRFCRIDRYVLRFANPVQMLGNYDSYACRDHAVINLHRVPG